MSNVIGLVRNDGTIGVTTTRVLKGKADLSALERDLLWTKTITMNQLVIEQHGMTNAVGALSKSVEFHIEERWEENPEFDLKQEHTNYRFAHDVLDATMSGLDINYASNEKPDYVAQLDQLISDLTRLRKNYA